MSLHHPSLHESFQNQQEKNKPLSHGYEIRVKLKAVEGACSQAPTHPSMRVYKRNSEALESIERLCFLANQSISQISPIF